MRHALLMSAALASSWSCTASDELYFGGESRGGVGSAESRGGMPGATTSGAPGAGAPSSGGRAATGGALNSNTGGMSGVATGGTVSAGTGGTLGSTGGSPGSGAVSASVIERADVVLHYQTARGNAQTNQIQAKMFLENRSADPLPLASVSVRYWMSAESGSVNPVCDYSGANVKGISERWRQQGDEGYVEITFTGDSIARGDSLNLNEFQMRMDASNGATFEQADDWSWEPAYGSPQPHDRITVYFASKLLWGCEPDGTCARPVEGGAGGGAGMGGAAGSDAGGTGGMDAGGADAGGTDAGGADAGGSSNGGADAGGTDAGGSSDGGVAGRAAAGGADGGEGG